VALPAPGQRDVPTFGDQGRRIVQDRYRGSWYIRHTGTKVIRSNPCTASWVASLRFIEGYSGIAAAIRSGSLKAIAVATAQRLPEFGELPTVAETNPGFTAAGWQILVAPTGTPEAIIRAVSEDLAKVVSDPDIRRRLAQLGSYSHPMLPGEVTAFVQEQQRTWKPALQNIAANAQ
jgi:tripartite-type tricarboxylate transporter receptor subunit TctC